MATTRIVLADDHAVVRAGLRNALTGQPDLAVVSEVGNGPDLMAAVREHTPDLIVIDVAMPDFEPVAAVRTFKTEYPGMRKNRVSGDAHPRGERLRRRGISGRVVGRGRRRLSPEGSAPGRSAAGRATRHRGRALGAGATGRPPGAPAAYSAAGDASAHQRRGRRQCSPAGNANCCGC